MSARRVSHVTDAPEWALTLPREYELPQSYVNSANAFVTLNGALTEELRGDLNLSRLAELQSETGSDSSVIPTTRTMNIDASPTSYASSISYGIHASNERKETGTKDAKRMLSNQGLSDTLSPLYIPTSNELLLESSPYHPGAFMNMDLLPQLANALHECAKPFHQ